MLRKDPLDGFVGDAREAVHAEADRGGRKRDFAAMIARAHTLDPANVSRAAVAEAAQFAPVVALPRRRVVPVPASEVMAVEVPPASPRRWLMAAAAGLLLAGAFAGAATQARRHENAATATAAPLVAPQPAPPSATAPGTPAESSRGHVVMGMSGKTDDSEPAPAGEATPQALDASEASLAPPDTSEAAASAESAHGHVEKDMSERTAGAEPALRGEAPRSRPRRPEARPVEATTEEAAWVALDRAAREAWRRGDTEEARALLSALVRSDAAAATIELAYGDLFVLARQAGDRPALARLWQRYLARFPRGLYAEDARVGLCRRASGAEAGDCWDMYLQTWPEGAYAGEARGARGMIIPPVMPAPASGTHEASRERGQEQE